MGAAQKLSIALTEELARDIEAAVASGEPQPMPDDWAEEVIRRGRERLATERRKAG